MAQQDHITGASIKQENDRTINNQQFVTAIIFI